MLNKYPLWKNLLVLVVLVLATVYAAPNLYPPDPAIQVTAARTGVDMTESTLNQIRSALAENDIEFFGDEVIGSTALFRLTRNADQLPAKSAIERRLGDEFVVALNLAPTTPNWLNSLGAGPLTLGLDLSGGVHFLMEVDMQEYVASRIANYRDEFRNRLRQENIRYRNVVLDGDRIRIMFDDAAVRDQANNFVSRQFGEFERTNDDAVGSFDLLLNLSEQQIKAFEDYAKIGRAHV